MFHLPATVIGMIGSAFMVASFAPGAVGQANPDSVVGVQTVQAGSKSDRIAPLRASSAPRIVSVVELVGVSSVTVVLKDQDGSVLFRSDPQTNTTYYSKDTDLPVLTLKEETASSVTRQPVSRETSQDSTAPKRRSQPHGCIGAVSPLAQAGKEAAPSLCVTKLIDATLSQG